MFVWTEGRGRCCGVTRRAVKTGLQVWELAVLIVHVHVCRYIYNSEYDDAEQNKNLVGMDGGL